MAGILVVGLGPCGLAAVKECAANGLDVVGVDAAAEIGGVFRAHDDGCYEGLHLTTSNVMMAFGDFPPNDGWIKYSTKDEYAAYLKRYVDTFDLAKRLELRTRVIRASRDNGAWKVVTLYNNFDVTRDFAGLVVATGANATPKMPTCFAGFQGNITHSKDYKERSRFAGARVLVVGAGESASDVAAEIARVAEATTIWSRRPVVFAPRFPELNLTDPNHDEYATLLDSKALRVNDFLEWATTARVGSFWPVWAYGGARQLFWRLLRSDGRAPAQAREMARGALLATNGHGVRAFWQADQSQWVTKNARVCKAIAEGSVRHVVAESVASCSGSEVTFSTGERVAADAIVCCTGYGLDFSWIAADLGCDAARPRELYKHCFPPNFKDAPVAFLGLARGHQGGIPQCGELQARYAALLFAGKAALPEDFRARAAAEGAAEREYYGRSPNLEVLVDLPSYMESVARLIGCEPRVPWWRPALCVKFLFYPAWPCWYRLRGPGADEAAAMAVLDAFPLAKSLKFTPFLPLFPVFWGFQRGVNVAAFPFVRGTPGPLRPGWLGATSKHFVLHGNALRFVDLVMP
ncbi:N,N-dimethylaniline monooxygenase [Aureococcus anophagefferens]|nr:N,N-dimethylaniline monooxygenase [Aureococcus anophagefferens]